MSCTTNIKYILTDLYNKLNLDPYNPELFNQIGCLYYKTNQIEEAIYQFKRCLSINPDNWQAHFNLGNCYTKKNFIEQAISHYKHSIKINENNGNAIQNLGMLLLDNKNFTEALPYLEKSLEINKENQTNFNFLEQLANCYLQLGNILLAIKYLEITTQIDPYKESAHHNLAILYLRNQNHDLAEKHFKAALNLNNQNHTARHMLNALQGKQYDIPPEEYIVNLFDQYSTYYNEHVKEKLQYELPNKFRILYAKHKHTVSSKNALDLGCGTGLCGIYFRDACVNLIGADLSKNMLLEAKKHNCYDLLVQINLNANNSFKLNYFDLIIASDLLPYCGSLENLFNNVKNLLVEDRYDSERPNNLFLFNIELLDLDPQDCEGCLFSLQKTGRYSHTTKYIEILANKFDFKIIEKTIAPIRLQDDKPVPGALFVLSNTKKGKFSNE